MKNKKSPSMLDAMLPVVVLLAMLSLAVFFFGDDSSSGPNQIALLLCAGIAAIVGIKNGHSRKDLERGIVQGISITIGAILILLAVGALIGTWLLAGTVPTMIYYGLQILSPDYFYVSCSIICALVALCIGSSWTVAATIGVALMGVATGLNASLAVTAGAIISGAYFGDKLSPLSDTTNLAAAVADAELFSHIKNMLWSTVPAYSIALILFFFLGINNDTAVSSEQINALLQDLSAQFTIAWYLLVPLLLVLFLAYKKMPAFPAVGIGAIVGGVFACLFQQQLVVDMAGDSFHGLAANIKTVWQVMYAGIEINTSNAMVNDLLSGGGMGSMLNTIWLVICAMTFGSIMERVGLLKRLVESLYAVTQKAGSLISTTIVTAFGTNVISADQYIAIVMPGRMFKEAYQEKELAPENLSRALEDGGTVTSVLVPWNTCGAYMQSVLMVNPLEFAVYCFFNWLSPLIGIACALIGFRVKKLVVKEENGEVTQSTTTSTEKGVEA